MPSKSKNKGKRGERELSLILSQIYEEFGNFGRVVGSGHRLGGKNIRNLEKFNLYEIISSRGDIIPPKNLEIFTFECKFYSRMNLNLLLKKNDNKMLLDWIKQAKFGLKEDNIWFLCMKFNNQGWYVLVDRENIEKKFNFELFLDLSHLFWYQKEGSKYYIFSFEEFFKTLKPQILKNMNLNSNHNETETK